MIAETVCFPKGRRQSLSRWRDRVGESCGPRSAARRPNRGSPLRVSLEKLCGDLLFLPRTSILVLLWVLSGKEVCSLHLIWFQRCYSLSWIYLIGVAHYGVFFFKVFAGIPHHPFRGRRPCLLFSHQSRGELVFLREQSPEARAVIWV